MSAESWQNYENNGNVHTVVTELQKNMVKHIMYNIEKVCEFRCPALIFRTL
jgi:hypothetical protein